jgi:hypothetical protein
MKNKSVVVLSAGMVGRLFDIPYFRADASFTG